MSSNNNTVEGVLIVYGTPDHKFVTVTKEAAINAAQKAKEQGKIIDYRIEEQSATVGKIYGTVHAPVNEIGIPDAENVNEWSLKATWKQE